MINKLYEKFDESNALQYAMILMNWDQMTGAPKSGSQVRAKHMSILSGMFHKIVSSPEVGELLETLAKNKDTDLNELERRSVEILKKEYDQRVKLPLEHVVSYAKTCVDSSTAWEEAKEKNDFSIFAPHLERVVELLKDEAGYLGYRGREYDYFLDKYEEGMNTEILDGFFETLKSRLLPLLKEVLKAKKETDFRYVHRNVAEEVQEAFSKELLEMIGFDLKKGMLAKSTHPFTTNLDVSDVRLTSKYLKDRPFSSVYSTIHEGGHAVYEQNIDAGIAKHPALAQLTSLGLHESQSKIYETVFGLNEHFIHHLARTCPYFRKEDGETEAVDGTVLYRELNDVTPSLIRIEADELTYPLHIIIRYEVEKAIFRGEIDIASLPALWNRKYKEYLGVEVPDDAQGVLQDMHWSDGSFGYFPTYSLGSAYAAQMANTMKREFNYEEDLSRGDFSRITAWLNRNIHQYGAYYKPIELLEKATGEKLNSEHFAKYLEEKYSKIYLKESTCLKVICW